MAHKWMEVRKERKRLFQNEYNVTFCVNLIKGGFSTLAKH